jgi:hypothetical protein
MVRTGVVQAMGRIQVSDDTKEFVDVGVPRRHLKGEKWI